MSTEYEKILKRRLLHVGGNTDDPSLSGFLSMFDSTRLPRHVRDEKNNVKKGRRLTSWHWTSLTLGMDA